MNDFFEAVDWKSASPALVQCWDGREASYAALRETASAYGVRFARLAGVRPLVFLYATNGIDTIALYLACLAADLPVALLEPKPAHFAKLCGLYAPPVTLVPVEAAEDPTYRYEKIEGTAYMAGTRKDDTSRPKCHADLALLLQTSGSTGSPKMVRLTQKNLAANARSIVAYLGLGPNERAVQSLPVNYSYGLSVVHSHLVAGGTMILTAHSFFRPEFWKDFDDRRCTSFAGVPYMYETLERLSFDPAAHVTLATLTQAGGRLAPALVASIEAKAREAGKKFFVMYGQTEATARIAYVPNDRLREKTGSIGVAVPGGKLSLSKTADGATDELVYEGPNVMMGYAEDRAALEKEDELRGVLKTGDLGRRDDDGFYFVTGRLSRFAKLFGHRVNLQDVETEVERTSGVVAAAVETGNGLTVFVEGDGADAVKIRALVAQFLGVTPVAIRVEAARIPLTDSGKKDYKALA